MPDLSTRVLAHLTEHGPMDVVALARAIGSRPTWTYATLLRLGDRVTREGNEWRIRPGAVVPEPPEDAEPRVRIPRRCGTCGQPGHYSSTCGRVSPEIVRRVRHSYDPWVHLLGTVPDRVIAEQAKVHVSAVQRWRKALGVAPCRKHVGRTTTHPEWWSLLGTMPDADIARQAGVTKQAVQSARVRMGVPRVSAYPTKRAGWAALVESRLGVVADRALAREVGMSADAVRKERKRRGIPATPPPKGTGRLAPYVHLLGTMPDSKIAAMAGVSPVGVCLLRKRLGVAAFRPARRDHEGS